MPRNRANIAKGSVSGVVTQLAGYGFLPEISKPGLENTLFDRSGSRDRDEADTGRHPCQS